MTNYGWSHNFNACKGKHSRRCRHEHKVQWYSNDPREVAENKIGTASIWIRRGAERYGGKLEKLQRRLHEGGR